MKTLLALLLLIPSLGLGQVLDHYMCSKKVLENEETTLLFFNRFKDYFMDDLGIKYSYRTDNNFFHLHIFETSNFEDMNWLLSIPKKDGDQIIFKYIDNADDIFICNKSK